MIDSDHPCGFVIDDAINVIRDRDPIAMTDHKVGCIINQESRANTYLLRLQ
jgi:hypothetical protein